MNELIMSHAGVKRVVESMKEVLVLYKNVTGNNHSTSARVKNKVH